MAGIWGKGLGFFLDTDSLIKAKAKQYTFCWKGFFLFFMLYVLSLVQ